MNRPLLVPSGSGGWLADRDPRLRLLAALSFSLTLVLLERPLALVAALLFALGLALASGIGAATLARRVLALEALLLVVVLVVPFSAPGTPWLTLGPLTATLEGTQRALVIALRANAVAFALVALLGTLEPVVLGHALARLKLPDKLVHLLLFTVRYIELIHAEYLRMRNAMRARGFVARADRHTLRALGWLVGMLLVRSYERSRRVDEAMRCRGFHGRFHLLDHGRWRAGDGLTAAGLVVVFGALLALGHAP